MSSSFQDVKSKCDILLASLPSVDYSKLRVEVKEICNGVSISSGTMSPTDLAADMERIQAGRDRMIEIFADSQTNATVRKDVAKMMITAAKKTSAETSADKREGDAYLRCSDYMTGATEAEAFCKFCETMNTGLNNKYNAVGKRINCLQESVKISAYGGNPTMAMDMTNPKDTSGKFNSAGDGDGKKGDGSTQEIDWGNL